MIVGGSRFTHRRLVAVLLCAAMLQGQSGALVLPAEGMKAVREGRYLAARDFFGAGAFDETGQVIDDIAFQMWAQFSPMVTGELPTDAFLHRKHVPEPDAAWTEAVRRATVRPALAEIVRRAVQTNIVILNEAHTSPQGRAFGLAVARALRPLGYSILAAETFDNDPKPGMPRSDVQLESDGFARLGSGTYVKDPVFAAFVRESLKIGYRPVAYEMTQAQSLKGASIAVREQAETDNLMTNIFAKNPRAKVLIYVGLSHAAEAPILRGNGEKEEWMAARLKRATGVDPLTIDQTTITDTAPAARVAYAVAAAKGRGDDISLFDVDNALVLGQYAGAVDLQVVHPTRRYLNGRPSWLTTMGGRSLKIPRALLPRSGERLVQVFAADAPGDAVPLDQTLVKAGKQVPRLYAPDVPVRFVTQP